VVGFRGHERGGEQLMPRAARVAVNLAGLVAFLAGARRPSRFGKGVAHRGSRRGLLQHRLEPRIELAEVVPQAALRVEAPLKTTPLGKSPCMFGDAARVLNERDRFPAE